VSRALTSIVLAASPQDVFGENYPRLVELKAIYDPNNVFGRSYNLKRIPIA
jgi:FAD/FMN-containing dehydrogenase